MGDASRRAAQATLVTVLDRTMRLLHPITPFITEAVWQRLPWRESDAPSIMVAPWPQPVTEWENPEVESSIEGLQEIIGATRNIRAEYGIQPAQRLQIRIYGEPPALRSTIEANRRTLADLARVEDVAFGQRGSEIGANLVLQSGAELFIPLAGVIDLERERGRLRSELERVITQGEATEKRLATESFVSRAPADVVEREREKLANFAQQREKLTRSLSVLEGA
jgi:valyl-tRNA synthetase